MEAFTAFRSTVVPLVVDNVDTDQIIPARFLKVTSKEGLGKHLFADWRYAADGSPRPDFILNAPHLAQAQVLLAGHNFGSGSSREHAPWALVAWGIRAVIARSFADIFRNNALKNGLLPIEVDEAMHGRLRELVRADADAQVAVDLSAERISLPDGSQASFSVDPFSRHCLLQGIDELGYIQGFESHIASFESKRDDARK